MFFNEDFVSEIGILCVFMNRLGKINVKWGFYKDYNVYCDFYEWELEGYIVVVFMEYVGMKFVEGYLKVLVFVILIN